MIVSIMITFIIASIISVIWVIGISKETEYRKDNPDYNPNAGWLDWDTAHTEGEI